MTAAEGKEISFTYEYGEEERPALDQVSFQIEKGELIAVLGANGSGKSTLARHLNAIIPLQEGKLSVLNIDVTDEKRLWELRRLCGMVFQNPDSQFVSSVVEEDVAFGPRNFDLPEELIPDRVEEALQLTGMEDCRRRAPHTLSGGQKQRAALAGVLAASPQLLVLDEATSMLDPQGREEVRSCIDRLRGLGKTILMITHFAEEAIGADRIILMKDGKIVKTGTPREILTDTVLLKQAKLTPPVAVRIYCDLLESGIRLGTCPLTNEEFVEEICRLK